MIHQSFYRLLLLLLLPLYACNKNLNLDEKPFKKELSSISIVSSSKDSKDLLSQKETRKFRKRGTAYPSELSIFINPQKKFQKFEGFGGIISDAMLKLYGSMPDDQKVKFINSYFGQHSIHYNMLRISMHSSKYSDNRYTYIKENDESLKTFSIEQDRNAKIPFLKTVLSATENDVKIYATPWSPPAFMKDNHSMLNGGRLQKKYYQHWSDYYVKFINEYENAGVPIWGVTLQNEPMNVNKWESCIFTADEEKDFLKNFLGPTLEKHYLSNKNIIVWNQDENLIAYRAHTIFDDKEAYKYAWGIGINRKFTEYGEENTLNNILDVYESYPNKKVLQTDARVLTRVNSKQNDWENAITYTRRLIRDLNQGIVGWTDSNLLTSTNEGFHLNPNTQQEVSAIQYNPALKQLNFKPRYYFLGHFSKYIKEDAFRVSSSVSSTDLLSTTFQNEDLQLVTVVLNQTDSELSYKIIIDNQEARITIKPKEIQTLVY